MTLEQLSMLEKKTPQELADLKWSILKNPLGDPDKDPKKKSDKNSKEKNSKEKISDETLTKDTLKVDSKVKLTTWFNALETAITMKGDARIRNYADIWLEFKLGKNALQVWYNGMNEFTQNLQNYFGRHVPNIWLKSAPNLKLIGVVKTTADAVIDSKYGLRYLVSDKFGVDYGRIDVAWGKNWASATFFLGKDIGKKWTNVELLEDVQLNAPTETESKVKVSPYTEFQLNQNIAKWFSVFVRWEVPWVKFKDGVYLLGVSKKFAKE